MKKIFLTVLAVLIPSLCFANSFTLLTSEPGRKAKTELSAEELFTELVKEVFSRADMKVNVKQGPWIRAQQRVRTSAPSDGLLITPLTRTKEREDKYDWILPLGSFKLQFVTTDKSIDLGNLDELKKEAVCVFRESPAEYKLKEMGFPDILSRVQVQKCYKGLKKDRQKVILAHGDRAAKATYLQVGGDPKDLIFGRPFSEYTVYLAASKAAVSESNKQTLENALDAMKIDGTYEKIFAKYYK